MGFRFFIFSWQLPRKCGRPIKKHWRCLVKSFNERNPSGMLQPTENMGHSCQTASDILEEGGDHVKSSWPLWIGLHTCYNGIYKGKQWRESERILKNCLSSDCSLQLESMKLESLVIVDQHATVNQYLSLVLSARHTLEVGWVGSVCCWRGRPPYLFLL